MNIHASAVIDPHAKIGRNVSIGPFVVIGPDVEIGENSRIISHAMLEYATLGRGCVVYPQASIGLEPQHMGYKGQRTRVLIGDNCTFREGVTVHRGTLFDQGITRVGNNGYFMALSHIAHDCVVGNNVIIANAAQLAGHVKIGDNCFISGTACVHQFVRIGTGSILSGGAMVTMDVAPFTIAQGDRASLRGLNIIGMRRMGMDKASIKLLKEAYRSVFLSGATLQEALRQPALLVDNAFIRVFHEFFQDPKRGYTRPFAVPGDPAVEEEVAL